MEMWLPPDRGELSSGARASLLADWMSAWIGRPVDVQVAKSYGALEQALLDADIELAWAPPAVIARAKSRSRFVLTAVRGGATASSAALIVRREDPARSIADLDGRRAAWVDPLSMSGYLSPIVHLRRNGVDPDLHFRDQCFYGSYEHALRAVASGEADLAAVYGHVTDPGDRSVHDALDDIGGAAFSRLRVLGRTPPAPYDGLVGTARMDPRDADDFVGRASGLRRDQGAVSFLLESCNCDRFEPCSETAYDWLSAAPMLSAAERNSVRWADIAI